MDESDGLENRYGGNLIVGSNPTPSARLGMKLAPRANSGGLLFGDQWPKVHEKCTKLFRLWGIGLPLQQISHGSCQLVLHVRQYV